MIKQEKKNIFLTTLLCLCPMILGILLLPKLPDQIAIHFNVHNEPDGFASKQFFVFFFPILMAVFHLICVASMQLDDNKEANKKMHQITQWIFPIVSIVMYTMTILYALKYPIDFRVIAMMILGVMLIVLGNYLPKTKNTKYHFGFHIGFSRNLDDKSYKKLARICGYMLIFDGFLMIVTTLLNPIYSIIAVSLLMLQSIILTIYTVKKAYEKKN